MYLSKNIAFTFNLNIDYIVGYLIDFMIKAILKMMLYISTWIYE